ncbi:hypothetical protein GPS59_17180 [Acinetobacter haemolyticus]|uniref:hypothetical protein n=1 Tax=Acinetobacter haemolyticus TaxID=29430 RepID=UPI001372FF43|nr:hypothetical protein [Acinetobacter haemolyticus]NAR55624.1 hypothetical protein [Acinetobacter haemolyticus]NAR56655.1 hypothetical protein [Acinetobacter haemolyticus]
MTNILNAQEAFAALQKGKTVLCRYAGDGTLHADKDFSTLDQMPATVFALPNYEFCIQVEMIELAGITFTKPLTIEEIEQGQDVFLIQPHAVIQQYKFNENLDELVDGIHAGFAQRDFENAQLQYKAFCEAVGGTPIQVNLEIVEQTKKKRTSKKQNNTNEVKQHNTIQAANDDTSIDDIIGPVTAQGPASNDVEKSTLNEISVSPDSPNNSISFDDIAAAAVGKAKEINAETVQKNNERKLIEEDEDKYQDKLATLKQRVDESKTVTEVNAVFKYTTGWTNEQLSPLLKYTHNRLEELQQIKAAEQPSLMVRIQNAPDLTALDALEIDVSSLDPVIQPEMMRYVRTRRLQLEQTASLIEEDLP